MIYNLKYIRIIFVSIIGALFWFSGTHSVFSQVDQESLPEISDEDLELIEEYLDQAQTLFEQRFTESTIFYYDKVLAIDSLNINALNGKAFVLDFVGSHEEAISNYDRVLLIDPKNNEAQLGKSLALESIVTEEELLLEISDEDLDLLEEYLEQAEEFFEEENYEEAISYYDKVLTIDSTEIDALNGMAFALDSIGKHEDAISYYDKVLAIDSIDSDALFGIAQALANLGKDEEAISYLNQAILIEVEDESFEEISDEDLDLIDEFLELAEEFFEEENYEEAISYYDKALAIDSTNVEGLFGKSLVLESLGQEEESFSNLEKISIQEPPTVEFRVPPEGTINPAGVEEIAEYDQILFVIVGVFIIILAIIILLDYVARRRKNISNVLT